MPSKHTAASIIPGPPVTPRPTPSISSATPTASFSTFRHTAGTALRAERAIALLESVPRRHIVHVAVLIKLVNQPRVDQFFDFDVRRLGILRGHEAANVAQRFQRRHRLALNARE